MRREYRSEFTDAEVQGFLKKQFEYDVEGFLRRRKNGRVVGWSSCTSKYRYGAVVVNCGKFSIQMSTHRAIYLMHHGYLPDSKHVIDHIDRNPRNSRIENLRMVTLAENVRNSDMCDTGATSHIPTMEKGIYKHSRKKPVPKVVEMVDMEVEIPIYNSVGELITICKHIRRVPKSYLRPPLG